jgi:hypothetical protein
VSSSPLGQYAPLVASVTAIGIVGAYVVSLFIPTIPIDARVQLGQLALFAIGAVFGSAVTVNGYKAPLASAHARLDRLQTAITATAVGSTDPATVSAVATILEDHRAEGGAGPPPASAGAGS